MFGLLAITTAEMEVGLGPQSFEEVVNKSHDECLLELTGASMGSFERNNKVLNEVLDALVTDFENDSPIEFVIHIILYVIVVACMPLILFIL